MPRVLIADDEDSMRSLVARAIAMDGHETVTAEDGAEALDILARDKGAQNSTDPLGRPMRHNEFTDDYSVKIPGEIDVQRVRRILEELRRRLADPSRPQIELDYIERLLKDY